MHGSLLGPAFSAAEIQDCLEANGAAYLHVEDDVLYTRIARDIAAGRVVGWFRGRMEFGPRALGARSIIGDPRNTSMQSMMNLKIKYRESFRPFAPSVLRERVSDYFELDADSPYMLLVARVREDRCIPMDERSRTLSGIELLNVPRSDIPAVTHIDYSARIQTVDEENNPAYYRLLKAFEAQTGCAVLVNTSFNVRGEPIVCSPQDAYRCFMRTEMDVLVLENYVCYKADQQQQQAETSDWRKEFVLD
jgi:carbamoyltransferase